MFTGLRVCLRCFFEAFEGVGNLEDQMDSEWKLGLYGCTGFSWVDFMRWMYGIILATGIQNGFFGVSSRLNQGVGGRSKRDDSKVPLIPQVGHQENLGLMAVP